MHKSFSTVILDLSIGFTFLSVLAAYLSKLAFGDVSFDQMLFHIQIGTVGTSFSDFKFLFSDPVSLALLTLATLGGGSLLALLRLKSPSDLGKRVLISSVLTLASLLTVGKWLAIDRFAYSLLAEDEFSAIYTEPSLNLLKTPSERRNLILIYVESLERAFLDFEGENLIKSIDSLSGETVPGFSQAPGTGWSIAGMVASQCGVPLVGRYGVNLSGNYNQKFLGNAICLGDILAANGYDQTFLVGPDLKFAGMDKFYRTHQFDHALGLEELRAFIPHGEKYGGWGRGVNDDALLDYARDRLDQLYQQDQPFNLTIITTDNHAPEGKPSKNCNPSEKIEGLAGVIKCTSRFVSQFVIDATTHPNAKTTDIFILGDHLFMATSQQIGRFKGERDIYFKVISQSERRLRREHGMTHFDVFPTILDSLGLLADSNQQIALGFSLFGEHYSEEMHRRNMSPGILNPSLKYSALWTY